jgi:hypothetical protein
MEVSLKHYIENEMNMQAIYQPMIIACLLEGGDEASVKDIGEKLSVFLHGTTKHKAKYASRIRKHPKQVLQKHGIAHIIAGTGRFSFMSGIKSMKPSERSEIIALCHTKIAEYLRKDERLERKKQTASRESYTAQVAKAYASVKRQVPGAVAGPAFAIRQRK